MANPRKVVAYDGIGALSVYFKIDGVTIVYDSTKANGAATTAISKAVTLSAADTVALAADGEFVLGKLETVEPDGMCTVQIRGYVTLPGGNGASLTRGKGIVGALNGSSEKGYIREVATGTAAELGRQNGFIQNAADTTAVICCL